MDMLESHEHTQHLQQHMYKLYQDGALCDLEIVSQEGATFMVHRLVLTASSKHLYSQCLHSACDASLSFDIPGELLRTLIEFSYTGQLYVTVDRLTSLQDAATFLQMNSALDLLGRHCEQVTSHAYKDVGNQTIFDEHFVEDVSVNSLFKLEDMMEGHQSERELIIKEEVISVPAEDGNQSEFVYRKGSKYTLTQSRTRLSCVENSTENKNDDLDYECSPSGSRSESCNRGNGQSNAASRDDDAEYKSETNSRRKIKVRNQSFIKTRRNVKSRLVADCNIVSTETNKGRILLRIQNSKIEKRSGRNRKVRLDKMKLKIYIPRHVRKVCPQCNQCCTSSVQLHRHQLYTHSSNNCSLLRYNYTVRLSKARTAFTACLSGMYKFSCKLCQRTFSKYSQFTMHYRKIHKHAEKPIESWLRYCSLRLAMQRLLVPFAKDRQSKVKQCSRKLKERPYDCSQCDKMFVSRYTLAAHLKNIHHIKPAQPIVRRERYMPPEPLFVCPECRDSQSSTRALYKHIVMKHDHTAEEAALIQHYLPDSLMCEVHMCEFKTQNIQEMKEHAVEHHPLMKYQCSDCSMTFKVLLLMKRHKFMCHVVGKFNFRCNHCEKCFRKGSMLRKHEYFRHGIQHDNVKIFRCEHPDCSYQTYTSSAIKLHQNKHIKEKLFTCEYCGLKLKTEKIHQKHVAKMHLGIRPFLCQVCGLSFGEKHELASHITNKHSNERNFQCQYCTYSTAVKGTFYTHLFNVHKVRADDDKRELYSCPQCSFTSILRYRYQTHVNGHTNTRNYECKICNKSFVSANTLRSHNQWVHSDKVYSCNQCDYQTKTSQKLNEHIRVQHQLQGFKPYKCPYCTFRCATGGNTRKHVKQVHKGEIVTYIRDDGMLAAARIARASGHYASLFNNLSSVELTREVSEDERSELSENILHIAM